MRRTFFRFYANGPFTPTDRTFHAAPTSGVKERRGGNRRYFSLHITFASLFTAITELRRTGFGPRFVTLFLGTAGMRQQLSCQRGYVLSQATRQRDEAGSSSGSSAKSGWRTGELSSSICMRPWFCSSHAWYCGDAKSSRRWLSVWMRPCSSYCSAPVGPSLG